MRRVTAPLLIAAYLVSVLAGCGTSPTTPPPPPTQPALSAPEPPAFRHSDWPDCPVQTVCLSVTETYPQITEPYSVSAGEAVQQTLAALGLSIVEPGAACDASVAVELTGEALSGLYSGADGGTCYTGARFDGRVTATCPGEKPLSVTISALRSPPQTISNCPKEPTGAPLDQIWPGAVLDALASLWGPRVYVAAFSVTVAEVPGVNLAAEDALRAIVPGQETMDALILALQDGDMDALAARVLGHLGRDAQAAVPYLIDALSNGELGCGAVEPLGLIGSPDAVPYLVQALGEGCGDAPRALASFILEDGVIAALIDALDGPRTVATGAQYQLEVASGHNLGGDQSAWRKWWREVSPQIESLTSQEVEVQALRDALSSPERLIRLAAVEGLGNLGPAAVDAIPALAEAVTAGETYLPVRAAGALGSIGGPAVDSLVSMLQHGSWQVRMNAAYALGMTGDAASPAVQELISALQDEHELVRTAAAMALCDVQVADTAVVEALAAALGDANHSVSMEAAKALGSFGAQAQDALPSLMETIHSDDADTRRAAAYALEQITGQALWMDRQAWERWWQDQS